MLHKIQLLSLKGCQDMNIEKQVITPSVVRISDKTEDKFSEQVHIEILCKTVDGCCLAPR